jgi:hypothetical protein
MSMLRLRHTLLLIAALVALVATSLAQPASDQRVLLPLIQQPGIALETIAVVDMPFDVYNAVQPQAVHATSGWWYISVYRTGDHSGSWLVRWREGLNVASAIDQVANIPSAVEPIPGGPYTDARGTMACGRDHRIYHFAWQGDGAHPKLVIGRLHGDTC